MNRLREYFAQPPEPESEDDFFEVACRFDAFFVSAEAATEIERQLDQRPQPRWIVFVDLSGSRQRILAEQVYRISECTAAQRTASREFFRARRLEEKKDRRPWEDDDC